MGDDLFSKPAEYTIDSSSLMDIFGDSEWTSMKVTPGLWERILRLINEGTIVSHFEVLREIKTDGSKGATLYDWAHRNNRIFKGYRERSEGRIIRAMSQKYKAFVNRNISDVYADPWLIAQAKCDGLSIITQEKLTESPNLSKWNMPNVGKDPAIDVKCLTLLELTRKCGWKFM